LAALRLEENIEHPLVANSAMKANISSQYFIFETIPHIDICRHGVLPEQRSGFREKAENRKILRRSAETPLRFRQRINWSAQIP